MWGIIQVCRGAAARFRWIIISLVDKATFVAAHTIDGMIVPGLVKILPPTWMGSVNPDCESMRQQDTPFVVADLGGLLRATFAQGVVCRYAHT